MNNEIVPANIVLPKGSQMISPRSARILAGKTNVFISCTERPLGRFEVDAVSPLVELVRLCEATDFSVVLNGINYSLDPNPQADLFIVTERKRLSLDVPDSYQQLLDAVDPLNDVVPQYLGPFKRVMLTLAEFVSLAQSNTEIGSNDASVSENGVWYGLGVYIDEEWCPFVNDGVAYHMDGEDKPQILCFETLERRLPPHPEGLLPHEIYPSLEEMRTIIEEMNRRKE